MSLHSIADKLRQMAGSYFASGAREQLCHEAADEIERLEELTRELLERCRKLNDENQRLAEVIHEGNPDAV